MPREPISIKLKCLDCGKLRAGGKKCYCGSTRYTEVPKDKNEN